MAKSPEKSIVYVDETGIDRYINRPHIRSKRGVKVYREVRGRKFERTSIVAGKIKDKIVSPMIYSGTANATLFEQWFENNLCPEVKGSVVVLDNASIHRKNALNIIASKHDILLLILPPYSPDLNKIENFGLGSRKNSALLWRFAIVWPRLFVIVFNWNDYTIKDIARYSGYGISTVSRAINNTGYVSPKTKSEILKAVKEANYVPNNNARYLKANTSKNIAIFASNISNPIFVDMIEIVERKLSMKGYQILI